MQTISYTKSKLCLTNQSYIYTIETFDKTFIKLSGYEPGAAEESNAFTDSARVAGFLSFSTGFKSFILYI